MDDIVRRKGHLTLGSRLKRISERLQHEVQSLMDLEGIEIQAFQYPMLALIDENGAMEVGQLARSLGVSQPGITRSVSQLTKQGIVYQAKGKTDKRNRLVGLTEKGHAVVSHGRSVIWPQVENCLNEIISDAPLSLIDHLNRLEDGLHDTSFAKRVAQRNGGKADG